METNEIAHMKTTYLFFRTGNRFGLVFGFVFLNRRRILVYTDF